MAGPTRLELATSGVTGRRSNQLNYDPTYKTKKVNLPISLVNRLLVFMLPLQSFFF